MNINHFFFAYGISLSLLIPYTDKRESKGTKFYLVADGYKYKKTNPIIICKDLFAILILSY